MEIFFRGEKLNIVVRGSILKIRRERQKIPKDLLKPSFKMVFKGLNGVLNGL